MVACGSKAYSTGRTTGRKGIGELRHSGVAGKIILRLDVARGTERSPRTGETDR